MNLEPNSAKLLLVAGTIAAFLSCSHAQLGSSKPAPEKSASWSLASPDLRCEIVVRRGVVGELSYEVRREGKVVLQNSPLGLRRDDQDFQNGLIFARAGEVEKYREQYELLSGPAPHVDHVLNHRTLVFRNRNNTLIEIELAAGNEGVAFRYRFPGRSDEMRVVETESTGFNVGIGAQGWLQPYHGPGSYTPAYEDFYFKVAAGEPPPRSRGEPVGWAFPALFEIPGSAAWVLITESGNDQSYCASHLSPNCSNGLYRIAFPLAHETTKGWTNKFGPEPRSALPWTLPWRVAVLGKTAGEIATSTLITDLAPASRIVDASWIKPGRASWSWWAYPNGPNTPELFNRFSDFASKMGWEYTLFDAGWHKAGLKEISSYAQSKGVMPLAWLFASDFYEPSKRIRKLDEMAQAGVRGVKVDFWCSDRQEAIAAMQQLFEEAASRHLVVNLHGCTLPRGWQRTWPNFLAAEGVLGSESYMFETQYTAKAAELSAVLPFTRNVAGPMDFTPVACSQKKYARTTTAAHELALALIFTSGLIHYADRPEFFESLPSEALQIFRDAPARWDETRCLAGDPGRLAVFARRSGPSWYVAGINGTSSPLSLSLDLSAFKPFSNRIMISEETELATRVAVSLVLPSDRWQHEMPARGGFILRLNK